MNPQPTRFVDLNRVLAELVSSALAILKHRLYGAYLQARSPSVTPISTAMSTSW